MENLVWAVIVTYRCGGGIASILPSLLGQVARIVVIDNGSGQETTIPLDALAAREPGRIRLIRNHANLGIAVAQNQGIAMALKEGAQWILLLDHDSTPDTRMVAEMLAQWHKANDKAIGIVAPRLMEENLHYAARYVVPWGRFFFRRVCLSTGGLLRDAAMVIASGCLIHCDVLRRTGGMREDFFIDNVDHEFCLRACAEGYRILVAGDAVLYHRQGAKTRHRLGPLAVVTAHYGPLRRYYMFRNRLWLMRLHGRSFPFIFLHETLAAFYDMARILLLEKNKLAKSRAALRGIYDGVTTISSPISGNNKTPN